MSSDRFAMKDSKLQESLSKSLPGFDAVFGRECKAQWNNSSNCIRLHAVPQACPAKRWSLEIKKTDIVHNALYNPKGWNDYPAVLPPPNTLMRLDVFREGEDTPIQFCAYFSYGNWVERKGRIIEFLPSDRISFRLWPEETA